MSRIDQQRVAGLGAAHGDRSGHDVHARARVGFGDRRPRSPDAIVHQQVGRVAGVVGDRLDLDDVAAATVATGGSSWSR